MVALRRRLGEPLTSLAGQSLIAGVLSAQPAVRIVCAKGGSLMASSEFYDVGPNRGRRDIDSTNRTQAYKRIKVYQENAMVVDHDSGLYEVFANGHLVGRYQSGLDAQDALRKATGADKR